MNNFGVGPFSHTIKAKTKPLPPDPPHLECGVFSYQSLKLKWGEGPSRALITNPTLFNLQMEDRFGRWDDCNRYSSLYHSDVKRVEIGFSYKCISSHHFLCIYWMTKYEKKYLKLLKYWHKFQCFNPLTVQIAILHCFRTLVGQLHWVVHSHLFVWLNTIRKSALGIFHWKIFGIAHIL